MMLLTASCIVIGYLSPHEK